MTKARSPFSGDSVFSVLDTRFGRLPVLAVCLTALALGCRPQSDSLQLTVMSFNIRYGTADDGENSWPYRRDLVFGVIRERDPDVLGLQEALRFQLDGIGAAVPGYGELGVGRDDGGQAGEYAAILYEADRFEVSEGGTFWFSDEPEAVGSIDWRAQLPRICSWARLVEKRSGRAFYVFNVHLDHQSQESRERSAVLLMERIVARAHPDPVIVTGDFNAGEDNPAMLYLLGGGGREPGTRLRDTFRVLHPDTSEVGTFNGFEGRTAGPKVDAVLVSERWRVELAEIVRSSEGGRYPSDHFPVVAIIAY
ncbi:MAG: endonuclease/exonuclease/phosphatase family protein [Gemmatimonadota bacterium]|nr:MAG: endonuclease/exonuclease/phosphatase family protein [Gemmatimonadota bacterium]